MVAFLNYKVRMNRTFSYTEVLTLYSCLRQIDLSIDRIRWATWPKFQYYFKINGCLGHLDTVLADRCESSFINKHSLPIHKSVIFKFKERLRLRISGIYKMPEIEIKTLCLLLDEFNALLNESSPHGYHLERLRVDIANFYTGSLGFLLSGKDFEIVNDIEHFSQNETLHTLSVSNIINQ